MFFLLAIENSCMVSQQFRDFETHCKKDNLTTATTVSKASSNLHQQVSVRLWQYNARMILERLAICSVDSQFEEFVLFSI